MAFELPPKGSRVSRALVNGGGRKACTRSWYHVGEGTQGLVSRQECLCSVITLYSSNIEMTSASHALLYRGVRRCFWMGGLTVWAAQPTLYLQKGLGACFLRKCFYLYALFWCILRQITLLLESTRQLQLNSVTVSAITGGVALSKNMGGLQPPQPPCFLRQCSTSVSHCHM